MDKLGWIKMDNTIVWKHGSIIGMPPEGIDVLTTEGDNTHVMYYVMSGEYRWINIVDDDEVVIPFEPTHWKFIIKN